MVMEKQADAFRNVALSVISAIYLSIAWLDIDLLVELLC